MLGLSVLINLGVDVVRVSRFSVVWLVKNMMLR